MFEICVRQHTKIAEKQFTTSTLILLIPLNHSYDEIIVMAKRQPAVRITAEVIFFVQFETLTRVDS
jgi:hypothetical protein